MGFFSVDEKTANKLLEYSTTLAQEPMEKWCRNTLKMQRNKAEDIYALLKKLKKEENWLDPILADTHYLYAFFSTYYPKKGK
jgi:hypothetical protein